VICTAFWCCPGSVVSRCRCAVSGPTAWRAAVHGWRKLSSPVSRYPRTPVSRSMTSRCNRPALESTICDCNDRPAAARSAKIERSSTPNVPPMMSASTTLTPSTRKVNPARLGGLRRSGGLGASPELALTTEAPPGRHRSQMLSRHRATRRAARGAQDSCPGRPHQRPRVARDDP